MRHKNTRPTLIYWLVDTRTNTPFYCGKTVKPLNIRFAEHRNHARRGKHGPTYDRLRKCGEAVRIEILETVPAGGDWAAREQRWIWVLRGSFDEVTNVSDGGEGVPGNVHGPETRAKQSKAASNRTPEHRFKLGASMRGKTHSIETRMRLKEANSQRNFPAEKKAEISRKISQALTGRKLSEERKEALRTANLGKLLSPEHCAKISAANKGKIVSVEQRKRISATLTGHTVSDVTRQKISKSNFGKTVSEETKAKLRQANIGKTLSPEHRAKIAAAHMGKKMADSQREALRIANTGKKHSTKSRSNMQIAQQFRRTAEAAKYA